MLQPGRKRVNHLLGGGGVKHCITGFVLVEFVDLLEGVQGGADGSEFLDDLVACTKLSYTTKTKKRSRDDSKAKRQVNFNAK